MKKRIVSLLLVFCMVITLVPANVLADEVKGLAETTAGQTQTAGTTAAKRRVISMGRVMALPTTAVCAPASNTPAPTASLTGPARRPSSRTAR